MNQQPSARAAVMNDVARLAGVSHQTVSRVLNNHPSVREETRERVLKAVRQLNYRPNALARGLAGRRSRVIGVVSFDTILYGPAKIDLGVIPLQTMPRTKLRELLLARLQANAAEELARAKATGAKLVYFRAYYEDNEVAELAFAP